ncbi:hypothetical protein CcCBS67573_g03296 [Chytriomyces confervae]|uniref:PWI domain-containing protein n=1 Tax=Chytriomyces confervae TaxID=246404 RepID=A0A507FGF3_9FUNG|nr:hypothetical protein HDU80_008041 [Chytriomyces hyalinus]TPX75429.1 hypothetical protein CcCBS67573_g03296 [Chytriomyces confervae]
MYAGYPPFPPGNTGGMTGMPLAMPMRPPMQLPFPPTLPPASKPSDSEKDNKDTAAAAPPLPVNPIEKPRTAFISKIPEGVSDQFMTDLLNTVGKLRVWTRVTSISGAALPFGFATYEEPSSLHLLLHSLARERRAEPGAPLLPNPPPIKPKTAPILVKVDVTVRKAIVEWLGTPDAQSNKPTLETETFDRVQAFLKKEAGLSDADLSMESPESKEAGDATAMVTDGDEAMKSSENDVDAFLGSISTNQQDYMILDNEEDEIKRLEKREREMHQAYLERAARFEVQEQKRIRSIEHAQSAFAERHSLSHLTPQDREELYHTLLNFDDDVEALKGEHEYFRDRSRWIRTRGSILRRELDADSRDRSLEAQEIEAARLEHLASTQSQRAAEANALAALESERAAARAEQERIEKLRMEREERGREVYHAVASSGGHGVVVGRIMTMEERKKAIEDLVAALPADWNGLVAWDVKWDFLEGGGEVVAKKIRAFVGKKVVEAIGEENQDIVEFVMTSVARRKGAQYILDELSGPLDDEAEVFVKKLWRMVMFESESRARGLA